MEIYGLNGQDYYINEVKAFGKSMDTPETWTVPLAIETGSNVEAMLPEGSEVDGEYTVNGIRTNFSGVVQEVAISREHIPGYDLYNLTVSETAQTQVSDTVLGVKDGGTGADSLNGILKGNGASPITTAKDGVDYWSPETLVVDNREVPWTIIPNTSGGTGTIRYAVKNGNVYVYFAGNFGVFSETTRIIANLPVAEYRPSINLQVGASTMGGSRQMAVEARANGDLAVISSVTGGGNQYLSQVISYPIGL